MPVQLPLEEKLPEEITQCHALIHELVRDIGQYQTRIDYLTRRLFGRSSEQMAPAELTFFGEAIGSGVEAEEAALATTTDAAEETPAQPSHRNGRRPLPKDLPRKRVEHDVPAEQKVCAECGCDKKRIGEETSEQLEYIPASLYVIEHVRPKYACPRCQGQVVVGEKPAQPIEKGLAGPGLLAQVITSKYCDHLPLHTPRKRWRCGPARSDLCAPWRGPVAQDTVRLDDAVSCRARTSGAGDETGGVEIVLYPHGRHTGARAGQGQHPSRLSVGLSRRRRTSLHRV